MSQGNEEQSKTASSKKSLHFSRKTIPSDRELSASPGQRTASIKGSANSPNGLGKGFSDLDYSTTDITREANRSMRFGETAGITLSFPRRGSTPLGSLRLAGPTPLRKHISRMLSGRMETAEEEGVTETDSPESREMQALVPYVIKLQRAYRLIRFVYKKFGPSLFVDSNGESSHGHIKFRETFLPARWIRVTPGCNTRRLVKLMELHWGLPKPEVLVTVTGGAQDFSLPPDLQHAFDLGIVSVASSARAWVFTSGSDAGVMKLVGSAVHRYDVRLPLIGVFPWGVTNGRHDLQAGRHAVCEYPTSGVGPTKDGAPLNPHHTHFILVDTQKNGSAAWGTEIPLRVALVTACKQLKGVPAVQLVVQGGPNTLLTVEEAALAAYPIVVLADSGGAAAAIYDYCTGGISEVDDKFKAKEKQLETIKTLNDAYLGNQLTFFSLRDGPGRQMDLRESLLESIINMMNTIPDQKLLPDRALHKGVGRSSVQGSLQQINTTPRETLSEGTRQDELMKRTLRLTVTWDEPELARRIIHMHAPSSEGKAIGTLRAVGETLQIALEMQREKIVKLFVDLPGFTVACINVGRLYLQRDNTGFLSDDRKLQIKLRNVQRDVSLCSSDVSKSMTQYAMYQKALSRFFYSISPFLARQIRMENTPQPHDIFFWLVCQGNEAIARAIWPRCAKPVHVALLGAAICNKMSLTLTQPAAGQARQRGLTMQEWAFGALETADEAHAYKVLSLKISPDVVRPNTCMDLAMATGAKVFLTQRHCTSLMGQHWRGGFDDSSICIRKNFNYLEILLQALLPPFNPYLWSSSYDARQANEHSERSRTESIIEALGLVLKIVGDERGQIVKEQARQTMTSSTSFLKVESWSWITDLFGPESQKAAGEKQVVKSKLASFYTAPAVKFTFRAVIQITVMALYVSLILNFKNSQQIDEKRQRCEDTEITPEDQFMDCLASYLPLMSDDTNYSEVLWLTVEGGLWLDARHQSVARAHLRLPSKIGVGRLSHISDILIVISFGMRIAMKQIANRVRAEDYTGDGYSDMDESRKFYEYYQLIVSVKAILVFLQILPFLSVYRPLGVLVITTYEMLSDFFSFSLLFLTITLSFSLGFMGLQSAGNFVGISFNTHEIDGTGSSHFGDRVALKYEPFGLEGAAWSPMWAVFGFFAPEQYDGFASIMLWIYVFTSSIVLVNLLVAMFAETFTKVQTKAEQEYVFSTFDRVTEHKHVLLATPPILNCAFIAYDLWRRFAQWISGCCSGPKPTPALAVQTAKEAVATAAGRRDTGSKRDSDKDEGGLSSAGPSARFSDRHVYIDENSPTDNSFDGKTLAEAYLKHKAQEDAGTALAVAAETNRSIGTVQQLQISEFNEVKARLSKLEVFLDEALAHRETKADPARRDQARKLDRIEKQLKHFMQAMSVQYEAPPEAPDEPAVFKRRRRKTIRSHVTSSTREHLAPASIEPITMTLIRT